MSRYLKIVAVLIALLIALHFSHPSPEGSRPADRISVAA